MTAGTGQRRAAVDDFGGSTPAGSPTTGSAPENIAAVALEPFAVARVRDAYDRIRTVDRPEVWITLRSEADVAAEAAGIDPTLPLAGLLVAVKDNIDVAGLPTTAAAPSYAYEPRSDSTAVARLRAAGAIVLGKTNLDQFATGLVGTRSPYGPVRNAFHPDRISGGSSSGSAVAVALGIADLALGTDTAGSGRVPAALHGIVGVKPTKGLVPVTGVVPACYTQDCVTVFARDLTLARVATEIMGGPDPADPLSRADRPGPAPAARPRVAIPTAEHLDGMAPGWAEAFADTVDRLAGTGVEIVPVDIAPLLEAAALLYEGAFVAERFAAVGAHLESVGADAPGIDPTVASIILAAGRFTAADWAADTARLHAFGARGRTLLDGCEALLTPTTTGHPTLAEVAADPVGANARLGRFTNFANLLDMAALAVPAGFVEGRPFGVMFTGAAFSDRSLAVLATRLANPALEVFVVGAHLTGQPLNAQIVAAGGTLVGPARTAERYRLHALDTVPAKPGLVRVPDGEAAHAIEGEVWRVPAAGFGSFVAAIPAPLTIGTIELEDGRRPSGFLVEPYAVLDAPDISHHGGWRAHLAACAFGRSH